MKEVKIKGGANMANHRKNHEMVVFTISWQDFIPPIFIKLFRWLDYSLFGKGTPESEKIAQLVAVLLLLSSLTFGLLIVRVLPEQVSAIAYLMTKDDYAVQLTDTAYQKAYSIEVTNLYNEAVAVGEIRLAPSSELKQGAVLGVTDEADQDTDLFDITPEENQGESVPQSYIYENKIFPQPEGEMVMTPVDAATYYSYAY